MPTPFTHLEIAQRLLDDPQLSPAVRAELNAERGAFLLGGVAADARVNAGTARADTHFYQYGAPIERPPHEIMLDAHPHLRTPADAAHRAFVAGYVAHLAVDEHWTTNMTYPHFALREWRDQQERYYMLHIILIHMDERDYNRLEAWQAPALRRAEPSGWLPFMGDDVLRSWRDLIYEQICDDGDSRTLTIFGGRIGKTPDQMRRILDSPTAIQTRLWQYIPRQLLAEVEAGMYAYARDMVRAYWVKSRAIEP